MMSNKNLRELKYDAHIAVLNTKVESLLEKQKELTQRVRANEKVVAAIGLLGSIALAFIGAGYFAAPADASEWPTAGEMINDIREWEAEKTRTSPEDSINNALADLEYDDGSDDTPKQEVLLQLPSSIDRQSIGRGHDRCHHRSWIRFIQERTGKNCGG
jgi:hypothetical protein